MKHSKFSVPGLMRYIVLANVVVYLLDSFSGRALSAALGLFPNLVLNGQIWRLVTFLIVPEPYELTGLGPVWFAFSMLFYYSLGNTIEREWGSAKFTLFYACGALLTLVSSFLSLGIVSLISPDTARLFGMIPITMGQVNFSLFLVFATLYPDAHIQIYFILPVKAKWLMLFYALVQVWDLMRLPGAGLVFLLPLVLPPMIASWGNYLLFFWSDITALVGRTYRRTRHQTSRQTINFKKAQKAAQEHKGYLHKCAVCGKTDTEYPDLEFRYCSKCNGYYCYCMEHINNHVHVE